MSLQFKGPAILVTDMAASRAFYEDVLAQEILFAVADAYTAYKSDLSLWEAGGAHQMIHGAPPPTPPGKQGKDNFELYFEAEDLDTAWTEVDRHGADVVHGPRVMPWLQRCFRIKDPDGHLVEVGEPMPVVIKRLLDTGMPPDQVAEKTMAPLEMVQAIAKG